MVQTAIYAVAKLFAYSAWCHVGLRWGHPPAATVASSLGLGATRWCIGLLFGIAIFFLVGAIDPRSVASTYFLIYSPVRAIEWGIMAVLIARRTPQGAGSAARTRLSVWCLGGIAVSFLTDLLSPEGIEGRVCVG